jgi:hypothetical protein
MKIRNVTENEIKEALNETNKKFSENIRTDGIEYISKSRVQGNTYRLRLFVKDSKEAGARRSAWIKNKDGSRRKMNSACWHVHGVFFDLLLKISPQAVINVAGNKKIFKNDGEIIGNWEDQNIGSYYEPVMYSEACECNHTVVSCEL